MKEPEPYRDADIWFSETEEEEEHDMSISSRFSLISSGEDMDLTTRSGERA